MSKAVVTIGAAVASAALAISHPAFAAAPASAPAPAADLASLQQQLNAMRKDYDARISDLEARLKAAEDRAATAEAAASAAPQTTTQTVATNTEAPPAPTAEPAAPEAPAADMPAPEADAKTTSANAMNPGVSVVLNGNYVATSRDPAGARISGFPVTPDAAVPGRGFSLGESEITLAANVDPFLTANLTASFHGDDTVSVEEAYVQTTGLPGGLTLKGGRFFSAIGYLNERHAHNWSFIDMPLPYRALLGNQYGDDGVQLRWLVPAPIFLEVGGELYRGDNFPAGGADKNKAGTQTVFVHTGSDIDTSSSWLAAVSYLRADAHTRDTGGDIFSGKNDLGIVSAVYKWAPGGNPVQRNLILSGEYFLGRQVGTFNGLPVSQDQRGWYVQGVYQFRQGWSGGLRYAQVDAGGVSAALSGSTLDSMGRTPSAFSGLLEYDTSEFGRFRAQYTHDLGDRRANDELFLQYTVVYGPHGAHRY